MTNIEHTIEILESWRGNKQFDQELLELYIRQAEEKKNDRFAIEHDEHGVQLHNDYIDKIARGINEYWKRHGFNLGAPEQTYGMIHRDRRVLEYWERELQKEGIIND